MHASIYCGTEFKNDYYLFKSNCLYKIVDIIVFNENKIFLVLKKIKIKFNDHYNCFKILDEYVPFHFENINIFEFKPFQSFNLPNDAYKCFKIRYL